MILSFPGPNIFKKVLEYLSKILLDLFLKIHASMKIGKLVDFHQCSIAFYFKYLNLKKLTTLKENNFLFHEA